MSVAGERKREGETREKERKECLKSLLTRRGHFNEEEEHKNNEIKLNCFFTFSHK